MQWPKSVLLFFFGFALKALLFVLFCLFFGCCFDFLLSQWLTCKLFGITYFVGKIKFELLFHGPLAE